ncbi:MAG: hypothetical protein EOO43_16925 [Flavobacterium sp.]|nr:MAG: hypothetical protein EOO43_16925 [Flavobacterium sp.]
MKTIVFVGLLAIGLWPSFFTIIKSSNAGQLQKISLSIWGWLLLGLIGIIVVINFFLEKENSSEANELKEQLNFQTQSLADINTALKNKGLTYDATKKYIIDNRKFSIYGPGIQAGDGSTIQNVKVSGGVPDRPDYTTSAPIQVRMDHLIAELAMLSEKEKVQFREVKIGFYSNTKGNQFLKEIKEKLIAAGYKIYDMPFVMDVIGEDLNPELKKPTTIAVGFNWYQIILGDY